MKQAKQEVDVILAWNYVVIYVLCEALHCHAGKCQALHTWLSFCLALLAHSSLALIQELDMPPELMHCYDSFDRMPDTSATVGETIHHFCLRQFLWKTERVRWSGFNITQKERDYINSLLDTFIHRRSKRQATGMTGMAPGTGFRIRREYRRITDMERRMFHEAVNTLKMNGEYDTFANLHSGMVVTSAHVGPNFFGWHRVYCALVEEALRRVNPSVSLPYWDSSLDFELTNPADSLIWTTDFLGNGDGFVNTGPFANWQTPSGPLTRNIGGASRLISKDVINTIQTRCLTREISEPTAQPMYNLELAHGGPHVWVGGQMAGLNTAAHDPVFFLHHSFIDYLWERFRMRQNRECMVNPETDYPPTMGQHAPERPMDGFPQFMAVEGYLSFWTRLWYNYEESPWCAWWRPFCRSPYLRCDVRQQRCVAVARRTAAVAGTAAGSAFGAGLRTDARVASAARGRAQESLINVGPRFRAPPSDGRTQDARFTGITRAGFRGMQQLASRVQVGLLGTSGPFGPTFNAPPSDGRTTDQNGNRNMAGSLATPQSGQLGATNSGIFNERLLEPSSNNQPVEVSPSGTVLRPPIQNTYFLNGRSDVDQWAYVPVKVIHKRTENVRFPSFPVHNGEPQFSQDVFSSARQSPVASVPVYKHCRTDASGALQITVTAEGLNYMGTFSDHALVDGRLPVASAMTYIGIKSPDKGMTEVMVAAHDGCGRMCQPRCRVPASNTPSYKACAGILRITSEAPKHYGKSLGDAVADVWHWDSGRMADESIRLIFYCNFDALLWKRCNKAHK